MIPTAPAGDSPDPRRPLPGPPLPVDAALPELAAALARGHAVLTAPPGSGKTTRVPLALLDAPWLAGGAIVMLAPRRPAARMAAARLAALLGEPVGETCGYQVRFERRIGPRTRIQVVTEGILTRRLQSDPELGGVGLLVFDEFHERSLQGDLGLALALDAVDGLRPDLRILVMSATLDAGPVADLLGRDGAAAPVVTAEGRSFPVDVRWADTAPRDPLAAMEAAIRRALAERDGDLLAFLPGSGEIERLRRTLSASLGDAVAVLPLHGTLPLADQQRALVPTPGGPRRVVLATDIAETSVTIEGVTTVIDSGLARKPRCDPGSGLTRLVTAPIPLASADQRAGRAGRLAPGVCERLWTRAQEVGRAPHRRPEILDADLAPLALELALWGVRDPQRLRWLDPPPPEPWRQAVALLRDLGALDGHGAVTALGRRMAERPVHPRLARMLAACDGRDQGDNPAAGPAGAAPDSGAAARLAADLAALLGERDGWVGGPGDARPADLGLRLQALAAFREGRRDPVMERARLAAADRLARRLAPAAPPRPTQAPATRTLSAGRGERSGPAAAPAARGPAAPVPHAPAPDPGALLALAYPDRIAQRRTGQGIGGQGARYLLAVGTGAELPPDDALAVHPYLVAAELTAGGRDARIRLALPIAEGELRRVLAERLVETDRLTWDAEREAVAARRETRLGALVLSSQPVQVADPEAALDLLLAAVAERFERALPWDGPARQLQARVALLRTHDPAGGWPDLSDAALVASLRDWLAPRIGGRRALAELKDLSLKELLAARLDWSQRTRLDELAPEALVTPAGNRRRLDYLAGPEPVLPVPIQELFGARETPAVCAGRVPVTLHLLSPAGRPMQVTRDLAGFWSRGYPEVRKELRGRYPKHPWPEDPAAAAPVTRVRPPR